MANRTFVIVGAGVAAASAAETLRSSGFDGRLVMIGRESDPPYNRPMLSKQRLRGEITDDQALFHPVDYYAAKEIELRLEREVQHVGVAEHLLRFADGSTLAYDRLLIATGAHPRSINAPGSDLPGVYYLRSLRDCRELSDALRERPRVLVLGTGFIGCEVAASARTIGCEVTMVGNKTPLANALGADVGELYARYHRAQGVDVRVGTSVERFEGAGRLERAVLFDGSKIDCEVAAIGIGVEASVDILRGESVEVQDGILVDELCRTSVPGIFAAGDVASSWNPRYARRLRVEHYYNARNQAVAAAKSMLDSTDPYNPVPSFWSDQYAFNMQYNGYSQDWDAVLFRGKTDDGAFTAFYMKGGVVEAVCSVNRGKENYGSRSLIGKRVEPRLLQDDAVDIKDIVSG